MANYAIIRVAKFKITDVQGIQKHNQRQGTSKSNVDIDYERSHLNTDLMNNKNLRYERVIKSEISERVERKPRANSVVLSEFLVTASPDYMKALSLLEQQRYFEKSLDFIKERYGEENTLYAVVHRDEANPHMHVGVVPITEDGRLSAKDIFNRKELQALQKDFPAELQRQGFEVERGQEGSKEKHLHPNEYKAKKDLEREVKDLEKNVEELQQTIADKKEESLVFSARLPAENSTLKTKVKEIKTEVTPRLFGKPHIVERETENFVLTPKNIEKLESVMTAAVTIKKEYERLQTTDLVKDNQGLREVVDILLDDHNELAEVKDALVSQNQKLQRQNRNLKTQVKNLKQEIVKIYDSTKEFVKEHALSPRKFKEAFRNLVDKVKEKTADLYPENEMSEFESIDRSVQNVQKKEPAKENELSR